MHLGKNGTLNNVRYAHCATQASPVCRYRGLRFTKRFPHKKKHQGKCLDAFFGAENGT